VNVHLGLGHELDPARRRHSPGQPQQFCFHGGWFVGLIDDRRELMEDLLEPGAIPTRSHQAPIKPIANSSAQAAYPARDFGLQLGRDRERHGGGFAAG
jgi:hypothetical protein